MRQSLCIVSLLASMALVATSAHTEEPYLRQIGAVFDGLPNPRASVCSDDGRHLYVTAASTVMAFKRNGDTGLLTLIDDERNARDTVFGLFESVSIALSPDGRHLYVAGDFDAAVTVFERDIETGKLRYIYTEYGGELVQAKQVVVSSDGNYVYATNISTDAINIYRRLAPTGRLNLIQTLSGSIGVLSRFVDVSLDDVNVYTAGGNTLGVFTRSADTGVLSLLQVLREGVDGVEGLADLSHVLVSNDNVHVYTASADEGAITIFSRNAASGSLKFVDIVRDGFGGVSGLTGVSSLALDSEGENLFAVSESNSVVVFSRDSDSGLLTFAQLLSDDLGGTNGLAVPTSISLTPDGLHLYITSEGDDAISIFSRDGVTGELSFTGLETQGLTGLRGIGRPSTLVESPGGERVYAATRQDGRVVAFDRNIATGMLSGRDTIIPAIGNLPLLRGELSMVIAPTGGHIYIASSESNAVITVGVDQNTGSLSHIDTIFDGSDLVNGIAGAYDAAISSSGSHLYVSGSLDSAITLFNRDEDSGVLTFSNAYEDGVGGVDGIFGITDIELAPSNQNLYAAGTAESSLAVFERDVTTGSLSLVQVLRNEEGGVSGLNRVATVTTSPTGEYVYTGSSDTLGVFRRDDSSGTLEFVSSVGSAARDLAVSADGAYVFATGGISDGFVKVLKHGLGAELLLIETVQNRVGGYFGLRSPQDIALSRDGANLYVAADFQIIGGAIAALETAVFASISGTVVDSQSSRNLACGIVELTNISNAQMRVATTDLNGTYIFDEVPTGSYVMRAKGVGYDESLVVTIDLVEGERITRDFSLSVLGQLASIRGRVTDAESHVPLVGVQVYVRSGLALLDTTYTCATGEYEFSNLDSKGIGELTLEYVFSNYESVARDVALIEGQTALVNQSMTKSVGFPSAIAGFVYGKSADDTELQPLESAVITIEGPVNQTVRSDTSGSYIFDAVLGGTYTIHASQIGYGGQTVVRTIASGETLLRSFNLEQECVPDIQPIPNFVAIGADGGSAVVHVGTSAYCVLDWDIAVDPPVSWLTFDTLKIVGPGTVTLSTNRNTSIARRETSLVISSNFATNSPVTVPVVQASTVSPPRIELEDTTVVFDSRGGTESIEVRNAGGGSLQWIVSAGTTDGWLDVSKSDDFISIGVDPNTSILRRIDTVSVSSEDADNSPLNLYIVQNGFEQFTLPTDVDRNGVVNAVDVQLVINRVLGIGGRSVNGDVNADGLANSRDIQQVLNTVLGIT